MEKYYSKKLAAQRLQRCYEIAPARVQQYLAAEIRYVAERLRPNDEVLELGCGYGRVMRELAPRVRRVVGIDTSIESLIFARRYLAGMPRCELLEMDAARLNVPENAFDVVVCLQNGVAVFHVEHRILFAEAWRVLRPGGRALFSSYSHRFWEARLEWFRLQAAHGLIGELDEDATRDGVIVCRDGFRATTVGADEFRALAQHVGTEARIEEVDGSSLFCEIRKWGEE